MVRHFHGVLVWVFYVYQLDHSLKSNTKSFLIRAVFALLCTSLLTLLATRDIQIQYFYLLGDVAFSPQ